MGTRWVRVRVNIVTTDSSRGPRIRCFLGGVRQYSDNNCLALGTTGIRNKAVTTLFRDGPSIRRYWGRLRHRHLQYTAAARNPTPPQGHRPSARALKAHDAVCSTATVRCSRPHALTRYSKMFVGHVQMSRRARKLPVDQKWLNERTRRCVLTLTHRYNAVRGHRTGS